MDSNERNLKNEFKRAGLYYYYRWMDFTPSFSLTINRVLISYNR